MSDRIEELIKEIAAKHGIAVARDDPILVLQTINHRLLQDSANAQQAQLDHFKEEMEAICDRWRIDANDKAQRIVNASLAGATTATNDMLISAAQMCAASIRAEVELTLSKLNGERKTNYRITLLNAIVTFTICAATLFTVVVRI